MPCCSDQKFICFQLQPGRCPRKLIRSASWWKPPSTSTERYTCFFECSFLHEIKGIFVTFVHHSSSKKNMVAYIWFLVCLLSGHFSKPDPFSFSSWTVLCALRIYYLVLLGGGGKQLGLGPLPSCLPVCTEDRVNCIGCFCHWLITCSSGQAKNEQWVWVRATANIHSTVLSWEVCASAVLKPVL